MRTTTLMTIQFLSIVLMLGSAEGLLCDTLPSVLFILSFAAFAACSIYINNHEKELIRDNNRRYGNAE